MLIYCFRALSVFKIAKTRSVLIVLKSIKAHELQ